MLLKGVDKETWNQHPIDHKRSCKEILEILPVPEKKRGRVNYCSQSSSLSAYSPCPFGMKLKATPTAAKIPTTTTAISPVPAGQAVVVAVNRRPSATIPNVAKRISFTEVSTTDPDAIIFFPSSALQNVGLTIYAFSQLVLDSHESL